ncbi:MAG: hypothetical protein WCH34_06390 [Bacteroidota bacterium]
MKRTIFIIAFIVPCLFFSFSQTKQENGKSNAALKYSIQVSSGLIIYSYKHHSFRHGSIQYYYSKSTHDTIKPLNLKNLSKDFKNPDFIKGLKALNDIHQKIGNVFMVNELYNRYIRKTISSNE